MAINKVAKEEGLDGLKLIELLIFILLYVNDVVNVDKDKMMAIKEIQPRNLPHFYIQERNNRSVAIHAREN